VSPVSYGNQDQSVGMLNYPMTSMDSMSYGHAEDTTSCERCGSVVGNNQDAILSHLQRCGSSDEPMPSPKMVCQS
jgi:hypothetical protein